MNPHAYITGGSGNDKTEAPNTDAAATSALSRLSMGLPAMCNGARRRERRRRPHPDHDLSERMVESSTERGREPRFPEIA